MSAKELFNEIKFNLSSNSDTMLVYTYKTDYEDISVFFNKEIKVYNILNMRFIDKAERTFVPMKERPENIKHSAYYGHWQKEDFAFGSELHNAIHQQLIELGWI